MSNHDAIFANLIHYNDQHTPFVDRYSQFGVVFEDGGPMGPGTLQVRSIVLHQAAADALLTLWIGDEETLVPVTRRELHCLPWIAHESGTARTTESTVKVDGHHTFLDERRLLSSFTFSSSADTTIRPVFLGRFSEEQRSEPGVLRRYGIADTPHRTGFAHIIGNGIEGGLASGGTDRLPSPALRIRAVAGFYVEPGTSLEPHWMPGPSDSTCISNADTPSPSLEGIQGTAVYFRFDAGEIRLRAGAPSFITFVSELSVSTYLHPEHVWDEGRTILDAEEAIESSRLAFLDRVQLSRPPVVHPTRTDRAWRARWALTRTGYQARGPSGEFGELIASTCVPTSGAFTRAFFWDALFASVAIGRFAPEFARGAILAQFVRQSEEGYCPEHGFNYQVRGRSTVGAPQAPVASWAVDHYLRANPGDDDFLARMYPVLERNHRYWECHSDRDRDGLAEWTWTGQTADDSPLWDEVRPDGLRDGCCWLPPVASVTLNSFLYRDALLIARFAATLGKDADARRFTERAAAIHDALMKVCYLPGERRFWDFNHATGRHSRVRTFYMCWPIWAGMPVPEETRRDLIENVLLDPQQFFGPVPFPSVAYDETRYDPRGYWRGKAWPQITYWLLEMLVANGYGDAADEAARRFLSAHDRERYFPENLSTKPSAPSPGGAPDYNWGIAAYDLIATAAYRDAL